MQKIDGRKWKLKWVEFGVRGGENGVDYKAEHVLCSCAEHVFNGMFFLWERNAFMGQSNIDTKKIVILLSLFLFPYFRIMHVFGFIFILLSLIDY